VYLEGYVALVDDKWCQRQQNRRWDFRWLKLDENMWMLLKKAPLAEYVQSYPPDFTCDYKWATCGRRPRLGSLLIACMQRTGGQRAANRAGRLLPPLLLLVRVARTLLSAWRFFSFTNSFSCARVCFCDQDSSKLVAADHQKSYWQQQLREILILSCEQSLIT
jgi:hypothetical protein